MSGVLVALALAAALAIGVWAWERSRRVRHPVPPGLQPEIELPHTEEWELYSNALSLCSMKTRVCLAELGIPHRHHPVDLIETGAYENIRPAFLRLNPGGTVPVLLHRGHPVYESHEQIRYAADHAPAGAPALVPEEPRARKAMQAWIDRSSLTDEPLAHGDVSAGNAVPGLTLPLFASMIDAIPSWRILEGLLFHFDRKRPLMFLLFRVGGFASLRLPLFRKLLARSRRQMGVHLDALEAQLAGHGGDWVLGDRFSLADVSWLVILERLAQAAYTEMFLDPARRPACRAYWERLRARPSYATAILGCRHPTIARGSERLACAKQRDPALRALLEGAPTGAASAWSPGSVPG